jgi:hypothetical protein
MMQLHLVFVTKCRRMIRCKSYPSITNNLWDGALWSPSHLAGSWSERETLLFDSTSNNSKHHVQFQEGWAVRAILPRYEWQGLSPF